MQTTADSFSPVTPSNHPTLFSIPNPLNSFAPPPAKPLPTPC
jgi:hypothetical protein